MTIATAIALAMSIVGYTLYSRLMTPAEFGIYAGALAIAKLGTTLLDGGLKVVLVKHREPVLLGVLRALFLGSTGASILALILTATIVFSMVALHLLEVNDAFFFTLYGAAYFLTYPILFIPLANLEQNQQYTPVAWAEAMSISVEYALPALLWLMVAPGFWSFIIAAWLARCLRAALVLAACDNLTWLSSGIKPEWREGKALLKEGLVLQIAVILSMLRDSMHLLLVGPWYGKEWAGFYAWALQLCAVASQVFVQTATRVALPALRKKNDMDSRWRTTLEQIAWLTVFTAPPLIFLTELARVTNEVLFETKWTAALVLLPFLIIRMLPGLVTTPLGSLVLASSDARAYAKANAWWTGSELFVATALLWLFGPIGLAWSYAFMGWIGVASFICQLPPPARFATLLPPLLLRPSLWMAAVIALVYRWLVLQLGLGSDFMSVCIYSAIGILISIALERRCWQVLKMRSHYRSPL